ncbi:MAG: anaerobic ribonucleoside-triphosphate reductase, partial [Candidatus Hydrogenedentales bacterium]
MYDDLFSGIDDISGSKPREGTFDAQLSFPAISAAPPELISKIIKRDGREVAFETRKIAEAIFKAAQSIGGDDFDRAEGLAAGVAIYLAKTLDGTTPTVDQVHDAVEKVLIELGHAKTGLAYARYRDKRSRIRMLRQGDVRAMLAELEEAGKSHLRAESSVTQRLCVRTSDDRIAVWNRDCIVEALVRETGLAKDAATMIAIEVENQIANAQVKALTAPLVREMVDAKLIEHGFEDYRCKHMRLGVPLYDAERIICAPNHGESEEIHDPAMTDLALAEHVKREFALSRVYSTEVADSHLRGDLHIHDIGHIDRLHGGRHWIEFVKRFGMAFRTGGRFAPPPLHAEALIAQTAQFNAALQNHISGVNAWDAFNVLMAPFLTDADARELRRLARLLIFGLSPNSTAHRRVPITEIGIEWAMPGHLRQVEAIGPGGISTGRVYGEYLSVAHRFAQEIVEALQEGHSRHPLNSGLRATIRVSDGFFRTTGHSDFLTRAVSEVALGGRLHFVFDRPPQPDLDLSLQPWQPRQMCLGIVSINLPRAAYRAGDIEGTLKEVEALSAMAVRAHVEKRIFILRLLALRSIGPLSLLAFDHAGRRYLDIEQVVGSVGVVGLNECVQALLGHELHATSEAASLGRRILESVHAGITAAGDKEHLRVAIASIEDEAVLRRFAAVDLQHFPEQTAHLVKADPLTQDTYYTGGARFA